MTARLTVHLTSVTDTRRTHTIISRGASPSHPRLARSRLTSQRPPSPRQHPDSEPKVILPDVMRDPAGPPLSLSSASRQPAATAAPCTLSCACAFAFHAPRGCSTDRIANYTRFDILLVDPARTHMNLRPYPWTRARVVVCRAPDSCACRNLTLYSISWNSTRRGTHTHTYALRRPRPPCLPPTSKGCLFS